MLVTQFHVSHTSQCYSHFSMLVILINVSLTSQLQSHYQGFSTVLCQSFRPLSVQLEGSSSPPCYRSRILTLFVSSIVRRIARAMSGLYDLIGDTTCPQKMLSSWILGLDVTNTTVLSSEHWAAISQTFIPKLERIVKFDRILNTEYIRILKIHRIPNTEYIRFLKNERIRIPNSAIWT